MGRAKSEYNRNSKYRLLNLSLCLLFFFTSYLTGQEASEVVVKNSYLVQVPEKGIEQGKRFIVKVLVFGKALQRPRIEQLQASEGIKFIALGDTLMEQIDTDEGPLEALVLPLQFAAEQAGIQVLPLLSFIFNDASTYALPEQAVAVALNGKPNLVPPRLRWELTQSSLMLGQTARITVYMDKVASLSIPQSITINNPPGLLLKSADIPGISEQVLLGGQKFLNVPAASWIIIATQVGKLNLPSVRLDFGAYNLLSPPGEIQVTDAPVELLSTGAIGDFEVLLDVPSRVISGQPTDISVRVEGRGNFSYLNIPELFIPNAKVISKSDYSNYDPASGATRGYRETRYRVLFDAPGSQTVSSRVFPYWDTGSQSLRIIESSSKEISIESLAEAQSREAAVLPALKIEDLAKISRVVIITPGTLVLTLFLVLCIILMRVFDFRTDLFLMLISGALILGSLLLWPPYIDSSALPWYEKAVSAHQEGKHALASLSLDQALRLNPDSSFLREIQKNYDLHRGIAGVLGVLNPVPRVFTEVFILLALILAAICFRFLKKVPAFRVLALSILLVYAGLGGALLLLHDPSKSTGGSYIGEAGATVRKIPENGASDWLALSPGVRVKTSYTHSSFIQIETSFGIQGWVLESDLIHGPDYARK